MKAWPGSYRTGLDRALVITVWLLFAVLACWLLGLPAAMTERILLIVRIAIIVAVGLAVVRATTVTVDTLNASVTGLPAAMGGFPTTSGCVPWCRRSEPASNTSSGSRPRRWPSPSWKQWPGRRGGGRR